MSEPRSSRRGTKWIVAGLLVTFVLIGLRVGLPIYRRKQAIDALTRIGASVSFAVYGEREWLPPEGTPGAAFWHANRRAEALFVDDDLSRGFRAREALILAREFPEINALFISNLHVDDDDVQLLWQFFPRTEVLVLGATGVSGKAVTHIAKLSHLRQLDLSRTAVDDAALKNLTVLSAMEYLNLDGTLVSNDGVADLAKFPKLRQLHVSNTGITDLGLDEFRRTHPDLEVTDD
jgi:hypothetical protein